MHSICVLSQRLAFWHEVQQIEKSITVHDCMKGISHLRCKIWKWNLSPREFRNSESCPVRIFVNPITKAVKIVFVKKRIMQSTFIES